MRLPPRYRSGIAILRDKSGAPGRCVGHPRSPPLPRRVRLRTPCRPPATHPTSQLEDTRRDAVTTADTPERKLALYRFTAVWRPGAEHNVVDCFSRHPVDDPTPDDSQEDDEAAAYVRAMLLGAHTDGATGDYILPLQDPHLTRLRTEVNSDDKYTRLRTTVQQGFLPTGDSWTPPQLRSMASDRTCGSPTTWLCTALGSSSQCHFGVKSCTACTLPTRAKTAPDAALDNSSTGQELRRIFRT